MADIMAISAAVSSIKTAIDIAKLLTESSSTLAQAELKLKLVELINSLADAKLEIALIQDTLVRKEREIAELKNRLKIQSKVVWKKPFYFLDIENGDGPYCQKCYDSQKELIRLQDKGNDYCHCLECKSYYEGPNYRILEFDIENNSGI